MKSEHEHKVDGCTMSPDFNFTDVCNQHDLDYHRGGSKIDRKQAELFKPSIGRSEIIAITDL